MCNLGQIVFRKHDILGLLDFDKLLCFRLYSANSQTNEDDFFYRVEKKK